MKEGYNSAVSLDSIIKDIAYTDSRTARWFKLVFFGVGLMLLGLIVLILCFTLAPINIIKNAIKKGIYGTKSPQ